MTDRTNALLTADQFRLLPEDNRRHELIQGELHMSPGPNRDHQRISGNIEYQLRKYLESNPIGELYDAPFDTYLTDYDVFQPDILFVAQDRIDILKHEGVVGAPTLVVDILSEGTAARDRSVKKRIYAESGVSELWLVDPRAQSIAVYRLQENAEEPSATYDRHGPLTSECFPGLSLDGNDIFRTRPT